MMRWIGTAARAAAVGVALSGSCIAADPATAPATPSDPTAKPETTARREIQSLLREQSAAWSRGDLEAFGSIYADDATFISPTGKTSGKRALLDRYRAKYPDKAAMGTLRLEVLEVRTASCGDDPPVVASVVARWSLTFPSQPEASGSTLLVFRRVEGAWRIVQDASM